jgi:hypothetical protein
MTDVAKEKLSSSEESHDATRLRALASCFAGIEPAVPTEGVEPSLRTV